MTKILILSLLLILQAPDEPPNLYDSYAELQFFVTSCGTLFVGYPSNTKVHRVCLIDIDGNNIGCFTPKDSVMDIIQVDRYVFGGIEATIEHQGRLGLVSLGLIPAITDGIDLGAVSAYPEDCLGVNPKHIHKGGSIR